MYQTSQQILVRVAGEFACFSCPDFGAERVSYPVMTPSAARGVLESVFWKPEMRFIIEQIRVLKEIRFQPIKRNEIKCKLSVEGSDFHLKRVYPWGNPNKEKGKKGKKDEESTVQRIQISTMALKDVEYVIVCRIALTRPEEFEDVNDGLAKYYETFMRRLRKGQCFQRPFLGLREFVAEVREATGDEPTISHTQKLGKMLMHWHNLGHKRVPRFFDACLENGVLDVPQEARY